MLVLRASSPDRLTVEALCLDTSPSKHLRYGGDKIELASFAFVTVVIKCSFRAHPISVEVLKKSLWAPKA